MQKSTRRHRGGSRVTLHDVATELSISLATASRALRDDPQISVLTRERVKLAARQMGYHPDQIASALAAKRTYSIGIMLSNVANPFFAEMAQHAYLGIQKRGYRPIVSVTDFITPENELERAQGFFQLKVDGVIAWLEHPETTQWMREHHLPHIVIGRPIDDEADCIFFDRAWGAFQLVLALGKQGHRRIAFLGPRETFAGAKSQGYEAGMQELGLKAQILPIPGYGQREQGRQAAEEVLSLEPRPSAVMAYNDLLAIGLIRGLSERGIRVPEEMAVSGFDGIEETAYHTPSVTTVEEPSKVMIDSALRQLVERIENPDSPLRKTVLRPRLVLRESTGCTRS